MVKWNGFYSLYLYWFSYVNILSRREYCILSKIDSFFVWLVILAFVGL